MSFPPGERTGGNYAALAYDVTISEYMTVDLHSPKEYTVNEDDLQEYFCRQGDNLGKTILYCQAN